MGIQSQASVEDITARYTMGEELGRSAKATTARCCPRSLNTLLRRGRFSIVQSALHLKENAHYAVKVVENTSLSDEENLEALETEAPPPSLPSRPCVRLLLVPLKIRGCRSRF